MTYVAVFSLVLMVAMPAVALIASRNSVNSRAIINGQVKADDIAKGAIRRGKIANGAVRGRHIKDGTIVNADIASDANISASKINRIGLNADLLDGSHASAFASSTHSHDTSYSTSSHDHDTEYSAIGHNHNTDYYTKAQSNTNYAAASHSHETTKTEILAIPASALSKRGNYDFYLEDGWAYGIGSSPTYADAPVMLPDGAVMTKMEYDSYDNDGTYESRAMLYRWSPASANEPISTVYSNTVTPTWQTVEATSIASPIIDNTQYGYFVQMRMYGISGNNIRVGTVRITYEYVSP